MATKPVSQLDENGFFVGVAFADESPLEPGVYLLPGGAIDAEAPTIPEGKSAKWTGEWVFVDIPPAEPEPSPGALEPQPVPTMPAQFTSLEFLDLFTDDEQLAIATAAMQSPEIKLWYDRALAASFISIADARTERGLDALVEGGMLTSERKSNIVDAMQ